ncbi:MAG: hypothetical protein RAK22_03100, partial [Nanoarchaeota archaeon]|nr:hypothetical protein [Nanoarchaeota archaeon]
QTSNVKLRIISSGKAIGKAIATSAEDVSGNITNGTSAIDFGVGSISNGNALGTSLGGSGSLPDLIDSSFTGASGKLTSLAASLSNINATYDNLSSISGTVDKVNGTILLTSNKTGTLRNNNASVLSLSSSIKYGNGSLPSSPSPVTGYLKLDTSVSSADLSNVEVWNITGALNYTASTTTNPGVITPTNKTYQVGGYNITIFNQKGVSGLTASGVLNPFVSNVVFNASIFAVKVKGPVAFVSGATSNTYYFVQGTSGLFASNGTSFSAVPLTNERGNLSYTGSELVYTEPTGGKVTLTTAENTSSFYTYLPNFAATKPDTWGAFVKNSTYKGSTVGGNVTFAIPTENYTVLVGGSEQVVG